MQLSISIPKVVVDERAGGSGKDAWLVREQKALLNVPGKLAAVEFGFRLKDGEEPFQPGEYDLDGSSVSAGKYGRLDFNPRPLKAVAVAAKRAA